MVLRKSWGSENFNLISESWQHFYQVSQAHFFLVWFRNRFESRAQIFKQGSQRLGESWILPFVTLSLLCTEMLVTWASYPLSFDLVQ